MTRNYATTLYTWLNTFADTYREPIQFDSENPMPSEYITYSADVGAFGQEFIQAISIYSQSTAWTYVHNIADAIESEIGEHGILLRDEWGYIKVMKGNPFYQDKPDEDSSIRAGYINLLLTIYQKDV